MVVKLEGSLTVLEAAKQRIINAFSNGKKVYVSFSGGKDSLCMMDIILKLAAEGKIDPSMMIVEFIDEEAMYDCVIKKVYEWRKKILLAGAKFNWFCLEVRHYSYFNLLEQDEYFICWDSEKKDSWVRQPPSFAIFRHPVCKARKDRYQQFLERHNADGISVTGVRMAESIQRFKFMTQSFSARSGLARGNMLWPMYDWKDTDIWRYLHENKIDIPDVYLYMYQAGIRINQLRVSQFFSIDTAKSLVKMNEYYPDLMDRIIRREPNAYLAALYWDSEMFRHSSRTRRELETPKDYKAEVFKLYQNHRKNFVMYSSLVNADNIIKLLIKYGPIIEDKFYKQIYDCLVAGDPKQRTLRGIISNINTRYAKPYSMNRKKQ
ncbi:MAG: phosphoadenosine phosphosulfate reductase family protein [Treponema sp.]|jgi:predicted phosphoadenosine phosphosulfate sulfurtransferase|nr:phosphoadenosine phosphosulfate reductase family protein [Treponema sp.]